MSAPERARLVIRGAEPEDVPLLMGLILELAEYEKLADQVKATDELIGRRCSESARRPRR